MHICSCAWLFALSTGMNITQSSFLLKCCSWKIKIRLALWNVWCLFSCILCSQPLKCLILIICILCSQSRKAWMLIELYFVFPVLKCLLFIQLYLDFAVHSAVFCVLSPSSSLSKIHRWVASGSPASLQHAASMKCQHRRWMGGAKAWLPCLSSMTLFEWSACSHASTAGCGRTATMPTLSLPQLLKTTKGKCWALHASYGEQGMAQWLQCQACDWKVAGLSPHRSRGRIFFFGVSFLSWHFFQYPFHPRFSIHSTPMLPQ